MSHHLSLFTMFVMIALAVSCAVENQDGKPGELPDSKSYIEDGVSQFMEVRCGAIDCHGQVGRPLRIYSQNGLRYRAGESGRVSGPTTNEERQENYLSTVGLEPEALSECFLNGGATFRFQLLQKPLDMANDGVRHKGGPVLRPAENDHGWQCLYGWAQGELDPEECKQALR
jgi:hypothetical protein